MMLRRLVPFEDEVSLESLILKLRQCRISHNPFADELIKVCGDLSTAMMNDPEAMRYPDVQAFAFWLRPASVLAMREEFAGLRQGRTTARPRGLVFHICPSNVATMFGYSWAISFLMGNWNIVRLPSAAMPILEVLTRIFREVLNRSEPSVASNTTMVRYDHDDEITTALSAASDVRMIWGGDATVSAIRRIALSPHAKDLAFYDRFSLSVLDAASIPGLEQPACEELAKRFFKDTYSFDQMACSSPKMVLWCGAENDCRFASKRFWTAVSAVCRKRDYQVAASVNMDRLHFCCAAAIDLDVARVQSYGDHVRVIEISNAGPLPRNYCGGGVFFERSIRDLETLVPLVRREDQTITHFGFSAEALRHVAERLVGCDRLVPVGDALAFGRYWDGYDLFTELTRHVNVVA
jgi:hypothetical protein